MLKIYFVDVRHLSAEEKLSVYKRLSSSAFMVNSYHANNTLAGFVVDWDLKPEAFTRLALSLPEFKYVDATGWRTDNDFIDQAFRAAFGRE